MAKEKQNMLNKKLEKERERKREREREREREDEGIWQKRESERQ
jgi:hypothetical protein